MSKTPSNHGKPWTHKMVQDLKTEVKGNTPTRVIALHLGRTPDAVESKASELKLSLKPVNQPPYGTKK